MLLLGVCTDTQRATLDGQERFSCHPTQSPASSPVQIRKGRVQELLQRREVRGRGLCMPLQLHLGMSHCKPTAMPREHLLSGWLCPLAQSDWLGDRGKPASVCLRAGRRRGRAVFPHLCLWKCQNRHLASQASGLGCGWEESRHGRAGAPQGRAGDCLWLRQCGTKVSFWMCPGTQIGLDNPPWAALGFSTRHHCLPCLPNCVSLEQAPVLLRAPSTPMGRLKAGPEKSLLAASSWQEGLGGDADLGL